MAKAKQIAGRKLVEEHERIEPTSSEKARQLSSVADTSDIEQVVTPPLELIKKLDGSMPGALCDQKYQIVWPSGPWKGMPISGYCAEPLCITEGFCTGTRFVPHLDQWTTTNPEMRTRRTPSPQEIVAAVRSMAKRAALQTKRDEDRTDREILDHVKMVWVKTIEQIRGKGDWRPS